ncbi:MAG TPA: AI-2E family transporter YdiK [Syntrophales bacterium]|mgnify:FL=1|nr:AI-2E family transporter YdiK [Syntrophales bacterium]HOX93225.1 AI-2E family transporter YdiK [Syntrophales bacterium]HPI57596.1 AI-2E family transporter YdiK [Syntrophales bacterium]HPN25391.1 AI-2E family transporter YdiK [Syntrophales bacterium]HQM29683.1 AI-2E family transporter YdiK [Syntrophales bacterium]
MTGLLPSREITRGTLSVLVILTLITASVWILWPFMLAFIWATMIVVATWPLMLRMQTWLWGRRSLAVAAMTLALLMVFIVPLLLAVVTIVENVDTIADWVKSLQTFKLPPSPEWVNRFPIVGSSLKAGWEELGSAGPEGLYARITPYAGKIIDWFVGQIGSVGMMVIQIVLTVVISAILYFGGETSADRVKHFARWLGGQRGEDLAILSARAIRGVALGVVATAFIQSVLGGIGLAVAGVPGVTVLTLAMFVLALAQLGVFLVLLIAALWLFWKGQTVWGIVLLVWMVVVGGMDNFLRPILIRRGANLPLLLVFAGVIGGLIAFGIIGIFIGPVVLAVTYTLLEAWAGEEKAETLPESTQG